VAAGDDEATRLASPPVKMKAPKGAAIFGDPSWIVDSTREVAHRRGGELNMAARVSIFAGQNSP
jgi:hypothetical protein